MGPEPLVAVPGSKPLKSAKPLRRRRMLKPSLKRSPGAQQGTKPQTFETIATVGQVAR